MNWEIIEEYSNGLRRMYKVQCSCGKIESRRKDHVLSGRTKECKVCSCKTTLRLHPNPVFSKRSHKGVGAISLTLWRAIRNGAKIRNIPFEISIEFAWNLFVKQAGKCALSGVYLSISSDLKSCNPDYSKITASLDRKNSFLGYTEENVQWVHKVINRMKGTLSDEEFKAVCTEVSNHKSEEPK